MMGFASWSVGEFLGREHFPRKFTALDSLLNKKFTSINAARSFLNGYLSGFIGLGFTALSIVVLTGLFKGKIDSINYRDISAAVPFLVPFLSALSFSLLSRLLRFRHWNGKRKTDTDHTKNTNADTPTMMPEPRRVQRFALVILFPVSVGKHGPDGDSIPWWSPCFPTLTGNRMTAKGRPCASSAPLFASIRVIRDKPSLCCVSGSHTV